MRKLNILKTCLDIFWIFGMIAFVLILFMLSLYLFGNSNDVPFRIKDTIIMSSDIYSKIVILINFICGALFIYSIYLLRKVITLFQKVEIFNPEITYLLNKIGKLIVFYSLLSNITLFAYKMYLKSNRHYKSDYSISVDFGGFDSFWISISLGMFFMVISEVFKIAKNMKEENELTI